MAVRRGANLNFVFSDHLGSAALTASGTKTDRAALQGLGGAVGAQTRYSSGSAPSERRYTGQIEESDLGVYFYNVRWYDPWLGRVFAGGTMLSERGYTRQRTQLKKVSC